MYKARMTRLAVKTAKYAPDSGQAAEVSSVLAAADIMLTPVIRVAPINALTEPLAFGNNPKQKLNPAENKIPHMKRIRTNPCGKTPNEKWFAENQRPAKPGTKLRGTKKTGIFQLIGQ